MSEQAFSDLKFIQNKKLWPQEVCCLIRSIEDDTKKELGFLVKRDAELVIHLGNIFSEGTGQTKTYDSAEDLLADGWLVD